MSNDSTTGCPCASSTGAFPRRTTSRVSQPRLARRVQLPHHIGKEDRIARLNLHRLRNRRITRRSPPSARCACRSSPRSAASDRHNSSSGKAAAAPQPTPTNRSRPCPAPTSARTPPAHRRTDVPFSSPRLEAGLPDLALQAFERRRFAVAVHQPHADRRAHAARFADAQMPGGSGQSVARSRRDSLRQAA